MPLSKGPSGRLVFDPKTARQLALTLVIGGIGGALFAWLKMPLAWMLGAMTATTIAALFGLPVRMHLGTRAAVSTILGVLLGATFTPALLSQVLAWPMTLGSLIVYIVVSLALGILWFTRVIGTDRVTGFFAAAPGGVNEMVLVGGRMGGDERVISLNHALRIMLVVSIVPIWMRLSADSVLPVTVAGSNGGSWTATDVALLVGCALVGYPLGKALRLPAAGLLGPMILSAIVHIAGFTEAKPPAVLVAAAQVVLGAGIGARFVGTSWRSVVQMLGQGLGMTAILLGLSTAAALILSQVTDYPFSTLLLAFAPGGIVEMSIVALAIGSDVAFIATHQVARLAIVMVLAPLVFRWLSGRKKT